jgi:putative transposase
MAAFVDGYNHTHHHTGIGLNTPVDVHYGLAAAKARHRSTFLADARARNPERFTTNQDPQLLAIPTTAWINNLAERTEQKLAAQLPLASFALTIARTCSPQRRPWPLQSRAWGVSGG